MPGLRNRAGHGGGRPRRWSVRASFGGQPCGPALNLDGSIGRVTAMSYRQARKAADEVLRPLNLGSKQPGENPALGVELPERVAVRGRRVFGPDQVRRLMAELAGWHRVLVELALLTRLRIGELLALRWRDVDLGRASCSSPGIPRAAASLAAQEPSPANRAAAARLERHPRDAAADGSGARGAYFCLKARLGSQRLEPFAPGFETCRQKGWGREVS